jgi:hypothetical protein
MEQLLTALQQRLAQEVGQLKYVDEDWGQLDYYSTHPPVQWPCCLLDISSVQWSNQGKLQQLGTATIAITIAQLRLTNTSAQAPATQRSEVWAIHGILQSVHQALHGYQPTGAGSCLYRRSTQRQKRDDGIQQYLLTYQCTVPGTVSTGQTGALNNGIGIELVRPPHP